MTFVQALMSVRLHHDNILTASAGPLSGRKRPSCQMGVKVV